MPFDCGNSTIVANACSALLSYCNDLYGTRNDWCDCISSNHNQKCNIDLGLAIGLPIGLIAGPFILGGILGSILYLINKYKINKFIKNHNIQNIITNNRNEDNNLSRLAYPMALIPVETSVRSNRTTNLIPMIIEEITPTENKNENYINIIPSNESNDAPPEYNV
jgi:hypothetical protein